MGVLFRAFIYSQRSYQTFAEPFYAVILLRIILLKKCFLGFKILKINIILVSHFIENS